MHTNTRPLRLLSALAVSAAFSHFASAQTIPPSTTGTPCVPDPACTAAFPDHWYQYGFEQKRHPVFSIDPTTAPSWLSNGVQWLVSPTGDASARAQAADKYFPADGHLAWGSVVAQTIGNVMGVSAANGIIYMQLSNQSIHAYDAGDGTELWSKELVNVAGMGQSLVATINGRKTLIVTAGDANFNLQNAIKGKNKKDYDRGASFTAVYAFDAQDGTQLWRRDLTGAARPAPLYLDGYLYVVNGDGHLYVLDATDGSVKADITNPKNGNGQEGSVGLASPNYHRYPDPATGTTKTILMYGTITPRNIVGVDITDPLHPTQKWTYTQSTFAANAPGDTSVAVDPATGYMVTTVFSSTATSGVFDLDVTVLNSVDGSLVWRKFAGQGSTLDGYKSGNPTIIGNKFFVGNPLDSTVQGWDLLTGTRDWTTTVTDPDPTVRLAPRAGPIQYTSLAGTKLILQAHGQHIRSFDPVTGAILNDFYLNIPGAGFGINQPFIIGRQLYISSTGGNLFAFPAELVISQPGFSSPQTTLLPQTAAFYDAAAKPSNTDVSNYPSQWRLFAGTVGHNAYTSKGPSAKWLKALPHSTPLADAPLDAGLYGTATATNLTHLAFGAGTGVTPANAVVYAGGTDRSISAFNAVTGAPLFRFDTINFNTAQPLVIGSTVIVNAGDLQMNLGNVGNYINYKDSTTASPRFGSNFPHLYALDTMTGNEVWRFFAGQGTAAMTPLYNNGLLTWVGGDGKVWSINASTGQPAAPLMDANGQPVLSITGFNAISSGNLYKTASGAQLLIAGMGMPNQLVAVNLGTATVAWKQTFSGISTFYNGFSTSSPAVDQGSGTIVGTSLVDYSATTGTAAVLVAAVDGTTGAIKWTKKLTAGTLPSGGYAPTPMIASGAVYLTNPATNEVLKLSLSTGATTWSTAVSVEAGKPTFANGVLVSGKLIQPMGSDLLTFDATTGALLNTYHVGGAFTFNHPSVAGATLYIGNSYGWTMALPVAEVTTLSGLTASGL